MTDLYSIDKYRLESEKIVSEDVIFCHSCLVSDLAQNPEVCETLGIDWEDELSPILSRYDWEEHARENIVPGMDRDECFDYLDSQGCMRPSDETTDEHLRELVIAELDESGDWQEFCDDQRSEPDATEAYEHWHVSQWLGRRLAERGEMVGELYGMTIWGRTCSGQSISMDGVMLRIAKELVDEREAREAANKGA